MTLLPDPLQLWRDALTKLEGEVNSLATGSLKSQEVARALHQFSSISMGMQQMFEKVVGDYLRRANLPSRSQMSELAESLQRIEDKLDRLLPPDTAAAPRPARTRRPAVAVPPAAEPPAPAPTKPRRAARRSGG